MNAREMIRNMTFPIAPVAQKFNAMQGRLRVSVTHACQLRCRFCHQEGIDRHWEAVHIDPGFLAKIVTAYSNLGGRYIELTGGEPTIHPNIGQLVDAVAGKNRSIILCTNGLRLDRVQDQIERKKFDLIRLSVHATDTSQPTKTLLGAAWNFDLLSRNVENVLPSGVRIQLIFTHTQQNSHYLESVLDLALSWNVELQVVDLIASRANRPAEELGYVGGDEAESVMHRWATLERIVNDRTGAVLKIYRTPKGKAWEIKDFHYGVLHTEMCNGCAKRQICGEGIYALRVDADGIVKPCLLREDLQRTLTEQDTKEFERVLEGMLRQMLAGGMQWT